MLTHQAWRQLAASVLAPTRFHLGVNRRRCEPAWPTLYNVHTPEPLFTARISEGRTFEISMSAFFPPRGQKAEIFDRRQHCTLRLKWTRLKGTACLARLVHRNTSNQHRHCRHNLVTSLSGLPGRVPVLLKQLETHAHRAVKKVCARRIKVRFKHMRALCVSIKHAHAQAPNVFLDIIL